MEPYTEKLNIKAWAEEDRPREKLLAKGKNALSDAELIAILIGSGSRNETAVELSKRILSSVQNDLNKLGKLTLTDLIKFKGIGEAKAITIAAALELGRRRKETESEIQKPISSSLSAYNAMADVLNDLPHEEFWVLYLNRKNNIIKRSNISKGGLTQTVVDAKIIFKEAINTLATSIIIFHNHPSGALKPSEADIQLTKKLKQTGVIMDIPVVDHIIIGDNNYFSFADENLI